ncbi:MAG: hypothetical protein IJI73_05345 [Kiritimatiellae bacterium]|nr:hypothetical protein [Kiritimatiellia bacterium]
MTEGPRLRICRWLAVASVAAYCLWQGISAAVPYFGSSDALSYLSDWRSAARNAPEGRLALMCSDAHGITPIERSCLVAMTWERAPAPIATVAAKGDLKDVDVVLASRWISRPAQEWLKAAGFSVSATNEFVCTWSGAGAAGRDAEVGAPRVSRAREILALAVELALMLFAVALICPFLIPPLGNIGKWRIAAAAAVVVAMGAVALSHPLLAPNGLGTYGGRARLLYECGGIPSAFLESAGGSVLQPSYPPGLALLAFLHFVLSGGCGDRLVQMIVAFAMSLVCLSMTRRAERWFDALPALLFCLSPMAVKMAAGFYAEPFAALMLVLGWSVVARGNLLGGALVMGLAGLFRPEAGVVAAAFAAGACALRGGVREKVQAIALSLAPAVLWIAVRKWLGYGGVPDWDLCAAPNFGHVAYAAWCEAKAIGTCLGPIAALVFLVRPIRLPSSRREVLVAFVPAALLLFAIPLACAFHTSPHANWMMDNTIPRLLWYVFVVPLFSLMQRNLPH